MFGYWNVQCNPETKVIICKPELEVRKWDEKEAKMIFEVALYINEQTKLLIHFIMPYNNNEKMNNC
jgi:hypothetical protein